MLAGASCGSSNPPAQLSKSWAARFSEPRKSHGEKARRPAEQRRQRVRMILTPQTVHCGGPGELFVLSMMKHYICEGTEAVGVTLAWRRNGPVNHLEVTGQIVPVCR